MDYSLPGPSIHGILQARILEWVAISFSRGSSRSRDRTWVSHIAGRCFNLWTTRGALVYSKWLTFIWLMNSKSIKWVTLWRVTRKSGRKDKLGRRGICKTLVVKGALYADSHQVPFSQKLTLWKEPQYTGSNAWMFIHVCKHMYSKVVKYFYFHSWHVMLPDDKNHPDAYHDLWENNKN